MRVSQRNLARIFSSPRRAVLRPVLPCVIRSSTAVSPLSPRSFSDETRSRAELHEIFNLLRWPTTKEEEAELVEAVRSEIWAGQYGDKRARNEQQAEAKRRKIEQGEDPQLPIYATQFSQEEIESEERRPKKKVAVLLGYSGTGYHGLQLNLNQRTIEGDLFAAFVAAGAISKANASDPKKSSLVRCARTDKGVHAAGNIVSLKMIVEDPDIVQKINEKLSPQIRVWGIEPTSKGFSCYQMCDSRIYEYLMPSHCLLPPHPSTYLGRKVVELAEQAGDLNDVKARQEEVTGFWEEVDEQHIKPILANVPEDVRRLVQQALYFEENLDESSEENEESSTGPSEQSSNKPLPQSSGVEEPAAEKLADSSEAQPPLEMDPRKRLVHDTIKAIKAAYATARRAYRVHPSRVARLQACLDRYEGTQNFFNYTIQKSHNDPSSKRHIKSFKVNRTPVVIEGTEWLSLRVHGQSFMMHQIRKMVAMACLVVRCGCPPDRIKESYNPDRIAIPKSPGLGLLLERPLFDSYNTKVANNAGRNPIDFSKYSKEMEEFKQREIYDRIFREEEETHAFGNFFNHIDRFALNYFLYVTSGGIPAARLGAAPAGEVNSPAGRSRRGSKSQREALAAIESASEDEGNLPDGGEEGG